MVTGSSNRDHESDRKSDSDAERECDSVCEPNASGNEMRKIFGGFVPLACRIRLQNMTTSPARTFIVWYGRVNVYMSGFGRVGVQPGEGLDVWIYLIETIL